MEKRTFKDWIIATRPWSFSASTIGILAPMAFFYWFLQPYMKLCTINLDWNVAWLCLPMILLFHAAGNLLGDYADHIHGVDSRNDYNGVLSMKSGKFTPKEIKLYGWSLILAGTLLGLIITLMTSNWNLLWFGGIGAFMTVIYYWLKYHAMGDLDILILFAMLPALGMGFLLTNQLFWPILYICLPYGLQTVAILHANNTRDICTDKAAGIHTMNHFLGGKTAQWLYVVEISVPFVLIIIYAILGILPYFALLPFITLPLAIKLGKVMLSAPVNSDLPIATLDQQQAKLQLSFGLTFCLGLLISAFL